MHPLRSSLSAVGLLSRIPEVFLLICKLCNSCLLCYWATFHQAPSPSSLQLSDVISWLADEGRWVSSNFGWKKKGKKSLWKPSTPLKRLRPSSICNTVENDRDPTTAYMNVFPGTKRKKQKKKEKISSFSKAPDENSIVILDEGPFYQQHVYSSKLKRSENDNSTNLTIGTFMTFFSLGKYRGLFEQQKVSCFCSCEIAKLRM